MGGRGGRIDISKGVAMVFNNGEIVQVRPMTEEDIRRSSLFGLEGGVHNVLDLPF